MKQLNITCQESMVGASPAKGYCAGFGGAVTLIGLASLSTPVGLAVGAAMTNPFVALFVLGSATYCTGYAAGAW